MKTLITMVYEVLASIKGQYVEFLPEPERACWVFHNVVDTMEPLKVSGEAMYSCVKELQTRDSPFLIRGFNMTISFVAIAYCLQAMRENSWEHAAEAKYWHGVSMAICVTKEHTMSSLGRKGADARHKETRDFKRDARMYYHKHGREFKNKDEAAQHIADKEIPGIAPATVRDWLKGIKACVLPVEPECCR